MKCKYCEKQFKPSKYVPDQKFCKIKCRKRYNGTTEKTKAYKRKYQKEVEHKRGYNVYTSIKQRCSKHKSYKGIKCLFTWQEFQSIFHRTKNCEWCNCMLSDNNRRNDLNGRQVNRVNKYGNYEKENIVIICARCHRYFKTIEDYEEATNYFKLNCGGQPWKKNVNCVKPK